MVLGSNEKTKRFLNIYSTPLFGSPAEFGTFVAGPIFHHLQRSHVKHVHQAGGSGCSTSCSTDALPTCLI